jgi:hypothetical protein
MRISFRICHLPTINLDTTLNEELLISTEKMREDNDETNI